MHGVRVLLPEHLRQLARVAEAVSLEVQSPVTIRHVLDALEAQHPMLRGTIRDRTTLKRRDFVRFFACQEDWSHESIDRALPDAVQCGREPLMVIGAMAGG